MNATRTAAPRTGTKRWTLVVLAAILAAGALLAWWTVQQADRRMRADLLQRARLVAQAVNLDRVKALSGMEAGSSSPAYLRLKEQFAAIRSASPQCGFLYLMGRKADGSLHFFASSQPAGAQENSLPGLANEQALASLRRVFVTRSADTKGPYSNRGGTWVSAQVPIHDPLTAMHELATPADVRMLVRKAVDYYRNHGRERFLQEINKPQGAFSHGDLYAFVYDCGMTQLAHPVHPVLVGWITNTKTRSPRRSNSRPPMSNGPTT